MTSSPSEVELSRSFTNTYYTPHPPLLFNWFERTLYLFHFQYIPVYIHSSLAIYILCEILWAIFIDMNNIPHSLAFICIMISLQFAFILINTLATVFLAAKLGTLELHRILLWPYGMLGYCTDYKQLSHLLIVESCAPFIHFLLWILFLGITTATFVIFVYLLDCKYICIIYI